LSAAVAGKLARAEAERLPPVRFSASAIRQVAGEKVLLMDSFLGRDSCRSGQAGTLVTETRMLESAAKYFVHADVTQPAREIHVLPPAWQQ